MPPNGRGTLAQSSRVSSPSFKAKRKSCARKFERCCCNCIIYFPLVFVYGLTSWAVWVQAYIGLVPSTSTTWIGYSSATLGIALYILLNWSYTTAVFTDPGSPLTQTKNAYSVVPSAEDEEEEVGDAGIHEPESAPVPDHTLFTVKSTGEARYCKKCHARKPDRAHHCSTCRRCVLKMDHHCPWLATCVGFRNYKPFILFLIYTSLFCWLCFAVTGTWVWYEMLGSTSFAESDRLMPVNNILLAVLSGIIGIVLTGFTGWHIYLACTGQTTIESLEKTRYLAPMRRSMQHRPNDPTRTHIHNDPASNSRNNLPSFASQLREIHANALPGITRPEEGIVPSNPSTPPKQRPSSSSKNPTNATSPAHASLRQNLAHSTTPQQPPPMPNYNNNPYHPTAEAQREHARYAAYLDELDAAKLPNAFDLGWRRNLAHVFGPRIAYWPLPVCNTTGDGWAWEPSRAWLQRREELAREREARLREEAAFARERWETMRSGNRLGPRAPASGFSAGHGRSGGGYGGSGQRTETSSSDGEDEGQDDDDIPLARRAEKLQRKRQRGGHQNWGREGPTAQWNDIPDEFLAPVEGRRSRTGARSRGLPDEGH